MATSEQRDGPTPNGGVKSVAHFFNADRSPTEKSNAVLIEIVEFDASGEVVGRTYLTRPGVPSSPSPASSGPPAS